VSNHRRTRNRQQQRQIRACAAAQGLTYQQAHQRLTAPTVSRRIPLRYPELNAQLPAGAARAGQMVLLSAEQGSGRTRWMLDLLAGHAAAGDRGLLITSPVDVAEARDRLRAGMDGRAFSRVQVVAADGARANVERAIADAQQAFEEPLTLVCIDELDLLGRFVGGQAGRDLSAIAHSHQVLIVVAQGHPVALGVRMGGSAADAEYFDYVVQLSRPQPKLWQMSLDKNRYGGPAELTVPWETGLAT
jgi:hypothetical protein